MSTVGSGRVKVEHEPKDELSDEEDELQSESGNEQNQEELEQLAEAQPKRTPSASPAPRRDVLLDLLEDYSIKTRDITSSPFDDLPIEIKHLFLTFLDYDPDTILCLSLVSRSWYKALNQGRSTEIDWQRRCNTMGILRRSPRCKTWRETFIRQLQKRCLICFQVSKTAYGHLLEGRPDWLKVCETCQMRPGPFQTIPHREAERRCVNAGRRKVQKSGFLRQLPFLAVKVRKRDAKVDQKYEKFLLASAVPGDPLDGYFRFSDINDKRIQDMLRQVLNLASELWLDEKDLIRLFKCAKECLKGTCFPSARLLHMVAAIDHWEIRTKPLHRLLKEAILYSKKVMSLRSVVTEKKNADRDLKYVKKPRLKASIMTGPNFGRSWGDAILTGTHTLEDYMDALREGSKKRSEIIGAKIKESQEKKSAQRAIRLAEQAESQTSIETTTAAPKQRPKREARVRAEEAIRKKYAKRYEGRTQEEGAASSSEDSGSLSILSAQELPPRTIPLAQSQPMVEPSTKQVVDRQIKARPIMVKCTCGSPAAAKCSHKRCKICCPGPCIKHKKADAVNVRTDSVKKEGLTH